MFFASAYEWSSVVSGSRRSDASSVLTVTDPLLRAADGRAFDPWFVGNTIYIWGQASGALPIQKTTCRQQKPKPCTVVVGTALGHSGRVMVESGTAGLREAVEAAQLRGGGIVAVTSKWPGTDEEFASVELPSSVLILDLRSAGSGKLYGPSQSGAPAELPSWLASADTHHGPYSRMVYASSFPGADLGQQISAAAAAAGESAEIVISEPGTISTPATLCPHCTLRLRAPVTIAAPIVLANGDTVLGSLAEAPLLAAIRGSPKTLAPLILGRGLSDVKVEGLAAVALAGKTSDVLFKCLSCTGVSVTGNIVVGASVALIDSTARGVDQTPDPQYPNVDGSNESRQVVIAGNLGYGGTAMGVDGIEVRYSTGVTISGNTLERYSSGIAWWGGDACAGNCTGTWAGDGAPGNVRKLSDLTISANAVYDAVQGCIWGSMGENVLVEGNVASGSGDVGIDTEGGDDITLSGNSVSGAANFQMAAFWLERNIRIVGNTLYSSHAGWAPIIEVRNAMQTAYDNGPIEISRNTIDCGDPIQPCSMGATGGAVSDLEIRENTLRNSTIAATSNNLNEVVIQGNQLSFDLHAGQPFDAIETSGTNAMPTAGGLRPAYVAVGNNTITFATDEPSGTMAIVVSQSDYNANPVTDIYENRIHGQVATDIEAVRSSANPGIVPFFRITGNTVQTGGLQCIDINGSSQELILDNHLANGDPWPPTP